MKISRETKISILGCDSSHADEFAKIIRAEGFGEIFSIWDQNDAIRKIKEREINPIQYGLPLEDCIKGGDIIFVEGRYGCSHFFPAQEAIKQGKPTYIDKPTTFTFDEAKALDVEARKNNVKLISFSPVCGDSGFQKLQEFSKNIEKITISAPAYTSMFSDSRAKDISFYGSHSTDMLFNLVHEWPKNVSVKNSSDKLVVTVEFETGRVGVLNLLLESEEFYKIEYELFDKKFNLEIDAAGKFYTDTIRKLMGDTFTKEPNPEEFQPALMSMLVIDEMRRNLV